MTLARPRNGDSNSSPWAFGSIGNTSIAAPERCPDSMFSRSATSSTTIPREALMKTDAGLHQRRTAPRRTARRSRVARRRGCSRSRTAPAARRACRPAGRCRARAGRRCRRRSPACRRPRRRWTAACRCCRSRRCRACGRGPRGCPAPTCPRCPSCIRWVFSGSRRASATISPRTSSTTLRVLENGALNTAIPRRPRRAEVDLVGPDAEAPDGQQVLGRVEYLGGDLGVGADPEQRHPGQRLGQLVPRCSEPGRTSTSKPVARGTPRRRPGGRSPAAVPSRDDTLGGDGTPASLRPGGRDGAG